MIAKKRELQDEIQSGMARRVFVIDLDLALPSGLIKSDRPWLSLKEPSKHYFTKIIFTKIIFKITFI